MAIWHIDLLTNKEDYGNHYIYDNQMDGLALVGREIYLYSLIDHRVNVIPVVLPMIGLSVWHV